jgi:predicted RNA-binding Zn-ribbon protein involved in translation (DUF1610 family)
MSKSIADKLQKTCAACGKPISATKRRDALYCCPACGNRARNRRYEKDRPERVRARRKKQNDKDSQRIYLRVKSRAKLKGILFNITAAEIIVPKHCPVLGIELQIRRGRQGYYPDSPSLDRIDPALGYIIGNVRVISNRANLLKSNATVAELEAVLADLKNITSQDTLSTESLIPATYGP